MSTTDSVQLLRAYAERGDEAAFRELVAAYIDLVYSTALRRVANDAELARDVTQTVFTDLARKAGSLRGEVMLGGWLHHHTGFVAATAVRGERRRQAREQQAAEMNALQDSPDSLWQQLAPFLDETIDALEAPDRLAIVLRFFERRDFNAIGAALGISDDAAQKRVSRALDKLRTALANRGVTSTAMALAAVLAEGAVGTTPVGLAAAVSQAALLSVMTGAGITVALTKLMSSLTFKLSVGTVVIVTASLLVQQRVSRPNVPGSDSGLATGDAENSAALKGDAQTPGANLSATNSPARIDKLVLRVVSAEDGRPIAGAAIHYRENSLVDTRVVEGRGGRNITVGRLQTPTPLTSSELGVCEIPIPPNIPRGFTVQSRTDGFVDVDLTWVPSLGDTIPREYTLRLNRSTPIGGRVVNAEGQPVAGAEVYLNNSPAASREDSSNPRISTAVGEQAITDAAGRWRIDRFAKEAIPNLTYSASHADYFRDPGFSFGSGSMPVEMENQLLTGEYVFKLARNATLRGVVTDTNNQPLAGVKITVLSPRGPRGMLETTNSFDGTFTLAGCRVGTNSISFELSGYDGTNMAVNLQSDSAPLQVTLSPGSPLRLRVVDRNGAPVPNATVSLNVSGFSGSTFGRGRSGRGAIIRDLLLEQRTDAEGRVVWERTPGGALRIEVSAAGMRSDDVFVSPDAQEHVITLAPALTISGTVRDAESGQSIPSFRMAIGSPGTRDGTTGFTNWGKSVDFAGGLFQHVVDQPSVGNENSKVFKFEAESYAPFISRVVRMDESAAQLDVALRSTASLSIAVLLPDGRPATNADIGIAIPGKQLTMIPGGFERRRGSSQPELRLVDETGHFTLPPTEPGTRVFAAHPDGFAEANPESLAAEPTMRLQPWGRIEGTVWSAGAPASNALVRLVSTEGGLALYRPEVQADGDGHFVFSKVPPGQFTLSKWIRRDDLGGLVRPSSVAEVVSRSGETTSVVARTYTVTARLRWPEGLEGESGLHMLGWFAQPKTGFRQFKVAAGGGIVAEDVSPGSYTMKVQVIEAPASGGKRRAYGEMAFTVPDSPVSGVLELGEIALQPAQ